jgi:hypothetical protein
MEDDRIVFKITVADLQEEVGERRGRKLTDEEILYLEKELPNCVSYGRSAYLALLWKNEKIKEDEMQEVNRRDVILENNPESFLDYDTVMNDLETELETVTHKRGRIFPLLVFATLKSLISI